MLQISSVKGDGEVGGGKFLFHSPSPYSPILLILGLCAHSSQKNQPWNFMYRFDDEGEQGKSIQVYG